MTGYIPALPNNYCGDYRETRAGIISQVQPPICFNWKGEMDCDIAGRTCYWHGRPPEGAGIKDKEVKQLWECPGCGATYPYKPPTCQACGVCTKPGAG